MQHNFTSRNIITIAILALIWGSSFILIKRGLVHLTAMQLAALRIIFAFIVLLPFAIKHFKNIPKSLWKYIFISGICGSGIPAFLFAFAQNKINSSMAGILNSTTPLFAVIFSFILFKEKPNPQRVLGIILGFLGAICLIVFSHNTTIEYNAFALLIIIATALYGINVNLVKKYLHNINPEALNAFAFCFNAVFAIFILYFSGFFSLIQSKNEQLSINILQFYNSNITLGDSIFYIFILGAMGSALSGIFFYKLIHRTNPIFASTVTYIMPLIAIFWGIIDGESLSFYYFIGLILILIGVWLVGKR
jgi:drug/metabolite transporter (DMT)-like permease